MVLYELSDLIAQLCHIVVFMLPKYSRLYEMVAILIGGELYNNVTRQK